MGKPGMPTKARNDLLLFPVKMMDFVSSMLKIEMMGNKKKRSGVVAMEICTSTFTMSELTSIRLAHC